MSRYAGPGHWNDPDMLEVGNGNMSFHENRSHFTMWSMLAAPLILGADLSDMPEEIFNIVSNKEVIAIDQDPLGKQAYRYVTNEGVDVWVKPLSGQRYAIAILNKSRDSSDFFYDWKWRGKCFFAPSGEMGDYRMYDIWKRKEAGTTEKPFEATLGGREVVLLLLTKA